LATVYHLANDWRRVIVPAAIKLDAAVGSLADFRLPPG
jgi:hypothetical protein